jgi:hypothetical protein
MKVTLPSVLFIVFLVLKLTEIIDWSWWWITAPLWGCFVIAFGFMAVACIVNPQYRQRFLK